MHTRVARWIEHLYVRTTGETVRVGQPLVSIFSRELLASQAEYLEVMRTTRAGGSAALASGARQRLSVLGMTDSEIAGLERRGAPTRNVIVSAERSGTVLHRGISVGAAVDPSTDLFTIADLSEVWVIAEVPQAAVGAVQPGTHAVIEMPTAGVAPIEADVAFVYPTLTERTRTLRVRFAIDNPLGALRPGEFGTATFTTEARRGVTVPRDAVIDTGMHQHVFVLDGDRLVPRRVELGVRTQTRIEVTSGLSEGETVAAESVFLIDSESRLRASGGATTGAHEPTTAAPTGAEGHAASPPATDTGGMGGMVMP